MVLIQLYISAQVFVCTLSTQVDLRGIKSCWWNKIIIKVPDDEPQQPNNNTPSNTPSCCACGKCQIMPPFDEDMCCRQKPCVTQKPFFENLVLDQEALSVAIVDGTDVLVDWSDFSNKGYWFATHCHFIFWQNGR